MKVSAHNFQEVKRFDSLTLFGILLLMNFHNDTKIIQMCLCGCFLEEMCVHNGPYIKEHGTVNNQTVMT